MRSYNTHILNLLSVWKHKKEFKSFSIPGFYIVPYISLILCPTLKNIVLKFTFREEDAEQDYWYLKTHFYTQISYFLKLHSDF